MATPSRIGSAALIDLVLDHGSFEPWDAPPAPLPIEAGYRPELEAARARTGVDESVVTGAGTVRGVAVAVLVGEFGFLGGSIGVSAAERLVRGIERATAAGLPILAAPVSGGTRMQEGTVAFLQMAKITAAVNRHKRAGLPYLVYLRHPTTGGVFASWGSTGHITVGQPGALIGFLGPRVYESLYGEPFPEGVQRAENLYAKGLLDAVLDERHLAGMAARTLAIMSAKPAAPPEPAPATMTQPEPEPGARQPVDAWTSIELSRRPDRPGVRSLLRIAAADHVPLNGTGQGESDRSLLLALARFGDHGAVVLGLDRHAQRLEAPLGPGALRQARRGMRLAQELELPLVTVVDTAGAALSKEAEEGGLAGEIARCLSTLLDLTTPTVSVLLGQGSGGGALALVPCDRVLAAEHGWLSPLPPEGASAIIHRDTDHAPELARRQRVNAAALFEDGIVDRIIAERPDAAGEPVPFCRRMGAAIEATLAEIAAIGVPELLDRRRDRYRHLG